MRRAFTLVEMVVGIALLLIAMSAAYAVLHLGGKSRNVTASAEGLRSALLIQERLEADLNGLVRVRNGWVHWHTGKTNRTAFYSYDPTARTQDPKAVGVRAVRWSLDAPGGYLQREWNRKVESVGTSPLTSIAFLPMDSPTGPLMRVTVSVGRSKDEPEGPPVVHSWLSRIPAPRGARGLVLEVLSEFLDPKDDESERDDLP